MRKINLILVIAGFIMSGLYATIQSQPFETIEISAPDNKFSHPVWSPDGSMLAFWGKDGIYVAPSDGSGNPTKIIDASGQDLMWASDSELVYWQRKVTKIPQEGRKPKKETIEYVRLVNLNGEEQVIKEGSTVKGPFKLIDGSVGCYREGEPFEVIRYGKFGTEALKKHRGVGLRRRASDNQCCEIWLTNADGTFEKKVTTRLYYYTPRLSPDGTKILVDDFIVLDINGTQLVNLSPGVTEVSKGIFAGPCCSKWSPDSKKIVYILETSDGHQVFNIDIWMVNIDGSERKQITDTPNEIEHYSEWSPDSKKVAYSSQASGTIYIAIVEK